MHNPKMTVRWLQKYGACKEAVEEFKNYKGDKFLISLLEEMIKQNRLDWANWLIVRNMEYKQYVSYVCYTARLVLDIFEKKYPTDYRPRKAIEAAEKCINNKSAIKAAKAAACAAACAAHAASYTISCAAYATAYAAYAACATHTATHADTCVAYAAYAACVAEGKEIKIKILTYGIQLLRTKENESNYKRR